MKIKQIRIQNFYSFKEAVYTFDKKGITLIEGINRDTGGSNGAGKSILLEAIVYGLFGKSIRKSTEEAMVNNQVGKDCSITIELEPKEPFFEKMDENLIIKRSRKPFSLTLEGNGNVLTQANARDTQAKIEELIGCDYKLFMASVVFGQHADVEFLGATPDEKRNIIKSFLNLEHIYQFKDRIKAKKSGIKVELREAEARLGVRNSTIEKYQKELDKFINHIPPTEAEINKIKENGGIINTLEDELNYTERTLTAFSHELIEKNKLLRNAKVECPTCKRLWADWEEKEKIRKELQDEISSIDNKIIVGNQIRQDIHKQIEFYELENLKLRKIDLSIKDPSTFEKLLKEEQEAKDLEKNFIQEKTKQIEILIFLDKVFSEQGLVKYVIRAILQYFNNRCNYYLGFLTNSKFSIIFDEELSEIITTQKRQTHYISLSGGEKRKINLGVMLALQDLLSLTSKCEFDLLFFDEVAENLDTETLQGLAQLILQIKKTKDIMLITHNKELKSMLEIKNTVTIIKYRGVSRIK